MHPSSEKTIASRRAQAAASVFAVREARRRGIDYDFMGKFLLDHWGERMRVDQRLRAGGIMRSRN